MIQRPSMASRTQPDRVQGEPEPQGPPLPESPPSPGGSSPPCTNTSARPMTANTAPVEPSDRSKRSLSSSENVVSKPLKANRAQKATTISWRAVPGRSASPKRPPSPSGARRRSRLGLGGVGAAGVPRVGLGQATDGDERVDPRDGGGDEERDVRPAERGERTDRRADDEADAERGAEQAEQAGPLVRLGDVGDRGLGDRHRRAADAVDDPTEREQPDGAGEAGDEAADRRPAEGEEEHRLAAPPVREAAEDRRADHLRDRERRHDQPDHGRGDVEVLGVAREERQDDPEADQVDGDRRPDGAEPRRQRATFSPTGATAAGHGRRQSSVPAHHVDPESRHRRGSGAADLGAVGGVLDEPAVGLEAVAEGVGGGPVLGGAGGVALAGEVGDVGGDLVAGAADGRARARRSGRGRRPRAAQPPPTSPASSAALALRTRSKTRATAFGVSRSSSIAARKASRLAGSGAGRSSDATRRANESSRPTAAVASRSGVVADVHRRAVVRAQDQQAERSRIPRPRRGR